MLRGTLILLCKMLRRYWQAQGTIVPLASLDSSVSRMNASQYCFLLPHSSKMVTILTFHLKNFASSLLSHCCASQADLGRVCQDELCPKGLEQDSPLQRHGRRHSQDELVALGSSYEGQTNASIAAGWLHESRLPCTSHTITVFHFLAHERTA